MELDLKRLPRHVAIIMDGNGRWAMKKVRNRIFGHRKGADGVRSIVTCCGEMGIRYLTLYVFSKENWNRPQKEVRALWELLEKYLKSELPELIDKQIRLRHIGDEEGVPASVMEQLRFAEHRTANYDKLVLSLALNYGGRQEITRAAKLFLADVLNGSCGAGQLTTELFSRYLYGADLPDPDLIIRTGGEIRVSNFLLWQIAYAELYFTDVLWPDFGKADFVEALKEFQRRERRFGRTSEQVKDRQDLAIADDAAAGEIAL
ncbi:undecaprenyl pyrophosphate synthase [Syntrophobacter sp. SbD1]|nr:undecaprenyl pyrophosphate synthase [Syntrophobacter sp. SbD1]